MVKIEVTVVENKNEDSCNVTVHKLKEYKTTNTHEKTTGNYIKTLIDNVLQNTSKGNI